MPKCVYPALDPVKLSVVDAETQFSVIFWDKHLRACLFRHFGLDHVLLEYQVSLSITVLAFLQPGATGCGNDGRDSSFRSM